MIKEFLISILLPLIFVLSPTVLLKYLPFYKKLDYWEKYIFNLSISTSFLTFFLTIIGYLIKNGFKFLSFIIYLVGIFFLIIFIINNYKKVGIILKQIFVKQDRVSIIFIVVTLLFITKALFFSAFKPIIDADVIDSYLPYARTIFLNDKIPESNYYNSSLMIFPPIGGPVLYSLFYNVTNNILTESFRFLPLIYIVGILICSYKIAEITIERRLAKLSLIILLIFPFWDELLFEYLFYPDIIALFVFLTFLYFFLKENLFQSFKKGKIPYYLITSFFLGTSLFFKVQYFVVYYFLAILLFISYLPRKFLTNFLLIIPCLPILYRLQKGIGYELSSSYQIFVFFILIYGLLLIIFNQKYYKQTIKINFWIPMIILLGLAFGSLVHLRNQFKYGTFMSTFSLPVTLDESFAMDILYKAGVAGRPQYPLLEWVIIIFPAFAAFWIFPKIIGLTEFLKKKKTGILLLFILIWYTIITLLYEVPNPRSLIAIFPMLALLVSLGIEKIAGYSKNISNFLVNYILISIVLSTISSTFLWWNTGLVLSGAHNLRKIISFRTIENNKTTRPVNLTALVGVINKTSVYTYSSKLNQIASKVIDLCLIMTTRRQYYNKNIKGLTYWSFISSLALICFSYFFRKRALSHKFVVFFILTFYFLPYLFIFILVPKGKIFNFSKVEQEELYNFWGQTKYIIPYLKKKTNPNDKIVFLGKTTGLSYYTNLRVYNLIYGRDFGVVFKNILKENDLDKIYKFYKKGGFDYFVISSYPEQYSQFKKIKTMTQMLDILDNKKYATLEIKPNEENFWYIYKLK